MCFYFYFFRKKKNKYKNFYFTLIYFHTKIKIQLHEITTVTQNLFTILLISYIIMNNSHDIH